MNPDVDVVMEHPDSGCWNVGISDMDVSVQAVIQTCEGLFIFYIAVFIVGFEHEWFVWHGFFFPVLFFKKALVRIVCI